jgi:NADH pyrophosphatase NudC (nudix superfamily)
MGKLSDADWQEMSGKLRARAAGLMRQLDAGAAYSTQIEEELARRLAASGVVARETPSARFCSQCGSPTAAGAKFCGQCGHRLETA